MEITRRTFLKGTLAAAALSYIPGPLIRLSHAKATAPVREFRFSASRTSINLGSGPDF
jgi:hypothetical protein